MKNPSFPDCGEMKDLWAPDSSSVGVPFFLVKKALFGYSRYDFVCYIAGSSSGSRLIGDPP